MILSPWHPHKNPEFVRLATDSEARQQAINTLCADEWPIDFSMQRYCRDQQSTGFRDLMRHLG